MEWRLLGPLEVLAGGAPVDLGARQRRTLLAVLVVHAGDAVSTDRLVEELWGDSPPAAARKTVQAHVARLRGAVNVEREALASLGDGYVLRMDSDEVDARRFEEMVAEAREMRSEDPMKTVRRLEEALGLFRGAPLAGLADNAFSLRVEAERLAELRLAAIEDRLDALLAGGDTQSVAAEAERLVAEYPLRERLWSILMLGLYRAGRQAEALRAYSRLRQTLAEELGIEPSNALRELEQRILDQDPDLAEGVAAAVSAPPSETRAVRNPYKGLRTFDEADASDFFGRSDLVRRLEERLEARASPRLLFLAGPSGAGKSSVVRAGLVPRLRDRHRVGIMFPGDDPVAALAKALSEATDQNPDDALAALESGELDVDGTVMFVDQFEELFTLASEEAARRFLDLLTRRQSVRWVATVRADFLDRLMTHPRLGSVLEDALVLIPPLQDHEIRAVVTGPAEGVGVEVEPELVVAVAGDVQARPSALPLLQYALADTFERRRSSEMTLADYQRSGGISGALARRAEELYSSLSPDQQAAARQLFLQLVTVTDEEELAKRRVGKDALVGVEVETSKIVERFGAQRLLTFDQDPETGRPTVEVAHEALMSEWPRFAGWIQAARDDLRMARRLAAAAAEWEGSERDPSFLLTGARLVEMERWLEELDLEVSSMGAELIERSREAEESALRAAERRRRVFLTTVSMAAVVAFALAIFAFDQAGEARRQTEAAEEQARVAEEQTGIAEEQARIATVRQLAASSAANLDTDPELAALLALEAVDQSGAEVLPEAEEALHRAVLADRLLARFRHNGEGIAHLSPDGRTFVSSGEDPTTVEIRSVNPGEPVTTLAGDQDYVIDAVYSHGGERIATASVDGAVRVWDAATGAMEITLQISGPPPLVPVFSWDDRFLAASSFSGTTWVWDLETEQLVWELIPPEGTIRTLNLEFSPDGSVLVVVPATEQWVEEFGVHVWDMVTGELITILEGHTWDVKDLGFTPDGSRLLTGSWDATVKEWDTETWTELRTFFGAGTSVWDLQVSEDGTQVAISGNNGMARVFDLETFEVTNVLVGHTGVVDGVDISPDGDTLLTASFVDRTTRLWDLSDEATYELMALPDADIALASGIAFDPDGTRLAASRGSGQVTIWQFPSGEEVTTFEGPGLAVDTIIYDSTGDYLALAGTGGAVLLDIEGNEVARLSEVEAFNAAFDSKGERLVVVDAQGVHLWSLPVDGDPTTLSLLPGYSAAFHPNRDLMAMSVDDGDVGVVEILDLSTGQVVNTITDHDAPVWRLTFSPDGRWLVTASLDTTAAIWDAETFEQEHLLRGHFDQVFKAAFDPIRPELATASSDETFKIWNLETGEILLTIPGLYSDIAYSPDGSYIAGAGPESSLIVHIRDLDELVEQAQLRLTRWWTETECLQYLGRSTCPDAPAGLGASD